MTIERRTFLKGVGAYCAISLIPHRAAGAAPVEPGIPVLVHYCNWHEKFGDHSSWHTATTLPLYSDGFCVVDSRDPVGSDCFNGYLSLDRATIQHHNAQFAANGLVPLISWWGRVGTINERSGDLFFDLYFQTPSSVKAGLLYEATSLLRETPQPVGPGYFDFGEDATSENAQRFISDLQYLNEKYFKRYPERVFTIDGRPVVFIWISQAFKGRFDLAVAQVRRTVPVYIIGSNFNLSGGFGSDLLDTVRGLDAVSSYGIYDGNLATRYHGHMSREYVDLYALSVIRWNTWLRENAPTVKLILPTQFTYHDNHGSALMEQTTPAEARYLAEMARALIDQGRAGCTNVAPFDLHVSYNEHFEGTSVEPSRRNRISFETNDLKLGPDYNDEFLKILREVFSRPLAPVPDICVP